MLKNITRTVDTLLAQMTLDEKLAQLGSYWIHELQTGGELDPQKIADRLRPGIGQITRIGGASTLDPTAAARAANQLQRFLVEHTRLGIPAILHEECCSGTMVLGGSMYPQMIGLASSFQPELAEEMAQAIRKQLRAIGARQGLAPVLDVGRDPRWGRIEETFGEDPTLISHFGAAYVRGLQGENLAEGVMATGKHFIGHSVSQGGLNCGPAHIGLREIYDVYLPPFQAAIRDAGLASMMNSYPELDGEVVAASRRILTRLLREELGFDGLLVSDYEAIIMLNNYHFIAPDRSTAARMALEAGIEVELPTTVCYGDALKAALHAGDLALETVDAAVRRHLQKKLELGLFENPYVDEARAVEVFETAQDRELARRLARQSMVLLKNDRILPLSKTVGTIAVIGPNANEGRNQLSDYSYRASLELQQLQAPANSSFIDVDWEHVARHDVQIVTVLEGIRRAVLPDTRVLYARGCDTLSDDRGGFDGAVSVAREADVVVLVLGDRSGLVPSCTMGETRDGAEIRLPGVQEDLAKAVIATGKPVVVVLVNGRPYALPWLAEHAQAIVEAWLPGEEGGGAVADILFGDCSPGGKLPVTFPRSVGQVPIFYNHKPSGMRSNWYVDYFDEKVTPLYPFGHGLSYTTFDYSRLAISGPHPSADGEQVDISLAVTNTGPVAGDEVVQLYLQDEYGSLPRPVKELKGYTRVSLQPGETRTVTFHLPVKQLAFVDLDFELVVEPGTFQVMVGSSSADIRLRGSFAVAQAVKVPLKERVLVCPVEVV